MTSVLVADAQGRAAARITVRGAVQGTGFRPFVYRLAESLGLAGSVRNTPYGVLIVVEGPEDAVTAFGRRLGAEAPPAAVVRGVEITPAELAGARRFTIEASDATGELVVAMLPDLATCPDCLRELHDRDDRRYRYPFLNCTACGPRLSIIEGLPYDRPQTTMRGFRMCPDCEAEYEDPRDRRFHAQPVACPRCGPRLVFEGRDRDAPPGATYPLEAAAAVVQSGRILAIKGLGGYQLIVDARDGAAVARLRTRKGREAKPLAVMFPSLEAVRRAARVGDVEAALLVSAAAPILVLPLVDRSAVSPEVAPGLKSVGAMLPYSPLHHLLLDRLGFPVVCTSGNFSEEPMAITAEDARARLGGIADAFLHHDRPIARHVDDSVARVVNGRLLVTRRARGFAPLPVAVTADLPTVRALGGHLKNAVAWSHGTQIVASQHIGDLDHPASLEALRRTVEDYEHLYRMRPVAVACDLHPDYATTRLAESSGLPVIRVQHHHAHVASAMAEHDLGGEVLGVAWDGTGLGTDGTVWGGEFLRATATDFRRVARLRPFQLPGGEVAARQPWRSALGVLHALMGEAMWGLDVAPVVHARARRDVLDALFRGASLLGAHVERGTAVRRGGLAARRCARSRATRRRRRCCSSRSRRPSPARRIRSPWSRCGAGTGRRWSSWTGIPCSAACWPIWGAARPPRRWRAGSTRTMARMIAATAEWVGLERVVLTGGCFQNAALLSLATRAAGEGALRRGDALPACRPTTAASRWGRRWSRRSRLLEGGR